MTSFSQEKPEAMAPFGAERHPRRPGWFPTSTGFELTVIQCPLQDGRVAGAAVPDAREGQHLDLVEHVLAQACELDAA